MTTTVRIAGIEFSGGAPGESGFCFNNLISWYGVPDNTGRFDDVPQRNRSFAPARTYVTKVYPGLEGVYVGETVADALRARNTLASIRNGGKSVVMEVQDDLMTTRRRVFLKRYAQPHTRHPSFKFALDFISPDPFRYGDEVSSSTGLPQIGGGIEFPIVFPIDFGTAGDPGRAVLTNDGEEETMVRFRVFGGLSQGSSIETMETGESIILRREIPDGSVVDFDPVLGRVKIDGSGDITGFLKPGAKWTRVPPGATRTFQFNGIGEVTGTPRLEAILAPAYL